MRKAIKEYYYFELLCGMPPPPKVFTTTLQFRAHHMLFCFSSPSDDLPVHGFLGTIDLDRYFLFTHVQFNVLYNKDQVRLHPTLLTKNTKERSLLIYFCMKIIAVNVTSDLRKVKELPLNANEMTVDFTYSVKWAPTDVPYEERHYLPSKFFNSEMEIHWLSIMNSFVLVILLTGIDCRSTAPFLEAGVAFA